jgi:hypothetical protein
MSSSPGARSKTRSTSKNETERAARYEKRYSPQSATDATAAAAIVDTPDATAAAIIAATPDATAAATIATTPDATAAATIAATPNIEQDTPEARCPELKLCQAPNCRHMDANYDICYYNELGEKTTQEICWRCRNDLKNYHKYRGGTIVSLTKTDDVDSEISDSEEMESGELSFPTTQRQSYDCQDLACLSRKPAHYIVTLKSPNEVFAKTKSICENCLPIYQGKTHFGDEQVISIEKKGF